ncbi:MAG: SPOR domain-containing protein [Planctomycetota bacterium]
MMMDTFKLACRLVLAGALLASAATPGCSPVDPVRPDTDAPLLEPLVGMYLAGRYSPCRQAVEARPASGTLPRALLLGGRSALATGDARGAAALFASAERPTADPLVRTEAMVGRAEALTRLGRHDEAIPLWGKLISEPEHRDRIALDTALLRLSEALARRGDKQRSAEVKRRLLETFADSASPHLDDLDRPITGTTTRPTLPAVDPDGTWYVQVAAVSRWPNVEKALRDLRRKNFTALHRQDRRSGLVLVLVGPYATKGQARQVRLRLIRRGYPKAFIKTR